MKVTIKIEKEVDVQLLKARANVRYWEDATINGEEDTDGSLTPCREGDLWCPIIEFDTGIIKNWVVGTTASLHFKVCDAGTYELFDNNGDSIREIDGYVPDCMCPKDSGYGDYIIMDIDANGQIANWQPDFDGFFDED